MQHSVLSGAPSRCSYDNLGHKTELQSTSIYSTIIMVICYGKCATKWTFVHALLDTLLRARLFILKDELKVGKI